MNPVTPLDPKPSQHSRESQNTDTLEALHWLYSVEQRTVIPIKWLVLLLVITLMLFQPEERERLGDPLLQLTLILYGISNLVFTIFFLGRFVPVEKFRVASYSSFGMDLIFISVWVLLTGGLESEFYFLFFLLILRSAALFQEPKKKFFCDTLMAVL